MRASLSRGTLWLVPYPANCADLRELVGVMRELGVAQAFHVTLGPAPTKAVQLEAQAAQGQPVQQELAEEIRRQRIQELVDEVELLLAATGQTYTREQLLQFVDPAKLRELDVA